MEKLERILWTCDWRFKTLHWHFAYELLKRTISSSSSLNLAWQNKPALKWQVFTQEDGFKGVKENRRNRIGSWWDIDLVVGKRFDALKIWEWNVSCWKLLIEILHQRSIDWFG